MTPSPARQRVLVVTHSPSPYQIELFDAVDSLGKIDLRVVYLYAKDPSRSWAKSKPRHVHRVLVDEGGTPLADDATLVHEERQADLLVMNWYRGETAYSLLKRRLASGRPVVFWGERPGFSHSVLGPIWRWWVLRGLRKSGAPIWGIGRFAIEAYQKEFGARDYRNIPYFSDLERFARAQRNRPSHEDRVVLFSGSLIKRKGTLQLARAFRKVALRNQYLRLRVMGTGPLEASLRRVLEPVSSQVEYLGFRDWAELPDVYATADVLCVPSLYDGWGLVVPEGLAAGLAVIATDRMGAALDLLRNGENGWLVGAGDESSLERALERAACLDEVTLRAMQRSARTSVVGHSLDRGAELLSEACRDAVEKWG